jgi:transcriptional regulator with XRE-family HTH domain
MSRRFDKHGETCLDRGGCTVPRIGTYVAPVDEKTIGKRLRELRKERGLTQVEVAERLGIQQALLSAYELGHVRVHGALVAAFATLYKVSADQILGLKEIRGNGALHDRRFLRRLEKIEKLPRRAKQTLLGTIDTYLAGLEKRGPSRA